MARVSIDQRFCRRACIREGSAAERFIAKVDTSGGMFGCWPWTGYCDDSGYGRFNVGDGRIIGAHLFSLETTLGRSLEPEERACHSCDNPPCVNPAHLFAGTQQANVADMVAKGRQRSGSQPGEVNPFARLTADQVVAIRRSHAAGGITQVELAARYGVDASTVGQIVRGVTWQHVA